MRRIPLVIATGLLALSLVGCAGQGEETATPEMAVDFVPVVSVTGEVVPAKWTNLSIQRGGTVVEVLVEPGDEVAAGDVLVRLDSTDAQLTVQQAEAALEAAQAQLALLKAAPRSQEIDVLQEQVESAEAALSQATAQRNQLTAGATEAEIAAAETEVAVAEAERKQAQIRYDEIQGKKAEDWVETESILRLRAAEQALEAAQVALAQVRRGSGARVREADAAVQAAAARRDGAQAQLGLLRAGATAQEAAVIQAGVTQAQVELDAAQAALERCELHAPFGGTIGAVNVREEELVAPGDSLVTLGDLSTLRVETTDLDEIDVARVAVGQEVVTTFDALPEQVFTGRVTRLSPMAKPGTGGVNYTVVIELDELDPAIRWGMTAFVDIETDR